MKARTRRRRIRPRLYLNAPPANPTANLRPQGVAAALGNLAREQQEPDLAAMVLADLGLPLFASALAGLGGFGWWKRRGKVSKQPDCG